MANDHWSKGAVLVLGGTGKTGRRVVEGLEKAGRTVRLGSRKAQPAFDWERPEGWAAALDGIAAVYVAYQPDLALPGAVAAVSRFFAEARAAGVGKIVLLSGRGEPEAQDAEEALRATSLDWTILRCSWFFQNFSENFFLDAILAGEIVLPDTLAPEPFVDADDIAEIAVAAFADARHSHQLYEITGAEALTFQQAIAAIAEACGRRIDYVPVSQEAYRAGLVEQGLPPEVVDLVTYLFSTVLDGRNEPIADGVARALGHQPRRFADYVARTAATGIWGGSHA
ncbi:NmrA family NAD(P)-binding protein [Labrys neptuniae]|uniref:NAD(P)H-binding protein n=1 Tax=Labrys neptuniae TaxID=376174 RepID=A0ABV3PX25_9HYPH